MELEKIDLKCEQHNHQYEEAMPGEASLPFLQWPGSVCISCHKHHKYNGPKKPLSLEIRCCIQDEEFCEV